MSEKIAVFTPNPGHDCCVQREGMETTDEVSNFEVLLAKTAVPSYALFTGIET